MTFVSPKPGVNHYLGIHSSRSFRQRLGDLGESKAKYMALK
jgi:hypothetical protein